MRLHRFIRDFNFQNTILEIVDKEIINQIKNVLRLKIGDKIILGDGKLSEALAKIHELGEKSLVFDIVEISKNKNESKVRVILYCSILKRENFEMVVQKATEVGVAEIIPIIARRTIKLNLKEDRLRKIMREAAEQAGRGIVPNLGSPTEFEKAVDGAKRNDINIFFDQSGQPFNQEKVGKIGQGMDVGVWVGPEGGWTEEEINLAKDNNFQIASLGKLTFRAETAAIIASYLFASN